MHGLKPIFVGLSVGLVAVGVAYIGLGARGLMQGDRGAAVLLGIGLAAALVGAVVWFLVERMGDRS